MALHEVQLKGYSVRPGNLSLGTFDSYGIEQLHVTADDSWDGLDILAVFHAPNGDAKKVVVGADGMLNVPTEATAKQAGNGRIVFVGLAENVQRITVDMGYNIKPHSDIEGDNPGVPTPDVVQQILQAALNAEQNSAEAKSVADGLRNDAASGKFDGKDGAKGDKGETGTTPQLKIGEDNLWNVSYDNGAAWISLGVKATGEAGKNGEDGKNGLTPHIGENGNWWVGNTDTGVSAKGDRGDTGAKGADGVSPTASVTQTDDGAEFTVTDASGTTTAMIRNGTDGRDGAPGAPGKDAIVDATLTQDGQAADAKVTGEKIGELKEDTTALQKRQNVLVGSETGNPASCNDAFAAPLCGLTVYGKSTQDGTPTPDAPVPIVSAGDDGSITMKVTGKNLYHAAWTGNYSKSGLLLTATSTTIAIKGTATEDAYITQWLVLRNDPIPLDPNKRYTFTPKLTENVFEGLMVYTYDEKGVGTYTGSNIPARSTGVSVYYQKRFKKDETIDFKTSIQLEIGTEATVYEPYREQLLTLLTPNGLPGIPVTSGGNYTDQTGQQWICDEVDLERGVKVQRVNKVVVDGETVKFVQTGDYANITSRGLPIALFFGGRRTFSTSTFTALPWYFNKVNGQFLYLIAHDMSDKINESCKKQLGKIYYALATPIETPLTPAEIAAYKALTAYAPNTVVQASDGAGIKLDYQRDVNLVVKNLEDAIASMTTT